MDNKELIIARAKAKTLLNKYKDYTFKPKQELVDRVDMKTFKIIEVKDVWLTPNTEQAIMVEKYDKGDSFTVLGSAGSGKTTMGVQMIKNKIEDFPKTWELPEQFYIDNDILTKHKYIKPHLPGFLIITFTNRAGETAARSLNLRLELNQYDADRDSWETHTFTGQDFCNTAHATLAYQLQDVESLVQSTDESGNNEEELMTKKAFVATRTIKNKLCPNIVSVLLDEAGMLSVTYMAELFRAFWLQRLQLVMMADLSQLPAIGEPSAIIASLGVMDNVNLISTWRFGGILLDWNTQLRTKKLVIPAGSAKTRTWVTQDESGNHITHTRSQYGYSQVDMANSRAIINQFYTPEEAKSPELALSKVCKQLTSNILSGKFVVGLDVVIIPQHVGIMGGRSIFNIVDCWLDHHYGRQNYLLNYSSGKSVIAVGDVMLHSREMHMIVGVEAANGYRGVTPQEGRLYPSRDEVTWLNLWEAKQDTTLDSNIDEMIEQFSLKSSTDLGVEGALFGLKDESINDIEKADYKESIPRQLSHRLLLLDLSRLSIALSAKYNATDSYKIASNLITLIRGICINIDNGMKDITQRFGHLQNIKTQLLILAEFYGLTEWMEVALKLSKSSNEYPNRGEKPGYQEGYFTGYQVQGSECAKIFVVTHRKGFRSNMTSNEFLYTSNTRAKNVIHNMTDERLLDGSLTMGGINYQAYKGITIEEKQAGYLKETAGKIKSPDMEYCIKTMGDLTQLNRFKKGGNWWNDPKFSIKYLTNEH